MCESRINALPYPFALWVNARQECDNSAQCQWAGAACPCGPGRRRAAGRRVAAGGAARATGVRRAASYVPSRGRVRSRTDCEATPTLATPDTGLA